MGVSVPGCEDRLKRETAFPKANNEGRMSGCSLMVWGQSWVVAKGVYVLGFACRNFPTSPIFSTVCEFSSLLLWSDGRLDNTCISQVGQFHL